MSDLAMSDRNFIALLRQGELRGSQCGDCEALFVPPRSLCPNCHRTNMQWVPLAGTGRLVAFTCISMGTPGMIARGYDRDHPYCSAVIELDEGPRVVARVEGVDATYPQGIAIGMRLVAQLGEAGRLDEETVPLVFQPAAKQ